MSGVLSIDSFIKLPLFQSNLLVSLFIKLSVKLLPFQVLAAPHKKWRRDQASFPATLCRRGDEQFAVPSPARSPCLGMPPASATVGKRQTAYPCTSCQNQLRYL